jgi:hypothetical protein
VSASEPEIVAARTVSGSFRFARRALAGCEIAEEVDPAPPHRPSLRSQAVRGLWISGPAARGPGYRGRMFARLIPSALAAAVLCAIVSGCSAPAEPAEPSPLFTSEEQAFAAAEETYRAYVDALNAVREDATSTPHPSDFLTGNAFQVDLETSRILAESGLAILGTTVIDSVSPDDISRTKHKTSLSICLDSSGTSVVNESGDDVTPADRSEFTLLLVSFVWQSDRYVIADSETVDEAGC